MTTCCGKSPLVGVEIQGLFDGVAYWECPTCGITYRRFEPYSEIGMRVERWAVRTSVDLKDLA